VKGGRGTYGERQGKCKGTGVSRVEGRGERQKNNTAGYYLLVDEEEGLCSSQGP
jgi:hypothetical protein